MNTTWHNLAFLWCTVVFLVTVAQALERESDTTPISVHTNYARFLKVYSKASPESEKEVGVGLRRHLKNLLNGGSIGIFTEFKPEKKLLRTLENSKKWFTTLFDNEDKELEVPRRSIPDEPERRKPKSAEEDENDFETPGGFDPRYHAKYQSLD